MAKGHFVFVPHLTHYLHIHESCQVKDAMFWYDLDDTFLMDWADALFYISPSWGADREKEMAEKKGLEVYKRLDWVPQVIQPCYASCGHKVNNLCEVSWSGYNVCGGRDLQLIVNKKSDDKKET